MQDQIQYANVGGEESDRGKKVGDEVEPKSEVGNPSSEFVVEGYRERRGEEQ